MEKIFESYSKFISWASLARKSNHMIGTILTSKGPIARSCPKAVKFGNTEESIQQCPEKLINPPITRIDDLFWLRDDNRTNETVLNHLHEENRFTKRKTAHLRSLERSLYDEHISYLQESHDSVPFKYSKQSEYAYFIRKEKGLSYDIYCRIRCGQGFPDGKAFNNFDFPIPGAQIILDLNKLASSQNAPFCDVQTFLPHPTAPDIFAYSVDFTGSETYEICFIGSSRPQIKDTDGHFLWIPGTFSMIYVTKDAAQRPHRIWVSEDMDGTPKNTCIYEETDDLFVVSVELSRCGKFVVIESSSSETTECHLIALEQCSHKDAVSLQNSMICIQKRKFGRKYSISPHPSGYLYILTNFNEAINNILLRKPIASCIDITEESIAPDFGDCDIVIPHQSGRYLQYLDMYRNFIVISGREDGLSQIWTIDVAKSTETKDIRKVCMPDPVYFLAISPENFVFDTDLIRFRYSTPKHPLVEKSYDMRSLEVTSLQSEKTGSYNPDDFCIQRSTATSFDGTSIQISMIMQKKLSDKEPHPLLLYGYGSYGSCTEPRFRRNWIPLLQRGVICCVAHVRGGSENGNAWYEKDGKYLTKRNTFMDFIACAEHLIERGWTCPEKLAIEGRSAGGLLIGAVLNMRPDLFKVAVASVPFVDVMTTMCDPSIPLTAGEWEEWGNPNEYRFHDYMLSYSPIDNVRAQSYPNILILAGLHDQRVQYWEPVKWASKLRAKTTGSGDILVKIDMNAGHFSASDRYQYIRELAFEQSYIISKIL